MNPEDFNYFQSRVSRFISGSRSGRSFLSGAPVARVTRISGIFPKRRIPQEILSKPSAASDDAIESSKSSISSLGRVTLDLEIINNNLDRIAQIILGDYKSTQETNKKEIEEYRKRVANRGRIFGKKELGDKKTDLLGGIKKFVGSFFSGTGGSIRALAMFNLLQGLMSGDPSKIIGPLLGIGMTYIPAIVGNIVSGVAGGLATKLFTRGGGAAQAAEVAAPMATKMPRFAKFGRNAALAGLFATMAASIIKPQEDPQQKRLEDLTAEQKASVSPDGLQPITQDDLKRFDNLNKKFEAALDFLLGKKGIQPDGQQGQSGGAATPPPAPMANPYDIPGLNVDPGSIASKEQFKQTLKGTPMESEADSIYEMSLKEGLNPAFVAGLAGAESSFGSAGLAVGRNNPFNYGVKNNQTYGSFTEATQALARALRDPQGPYAGKRTLLDIINTYSPATENDVAQHIRNIMSIGSRTGGDPASLFLNLGAAGRSVPMRNPSVATPPVTRRPAATTPAARQQPRVIMIPAETGTGDQQSSAAVGANDIVPAIDTTYPENFLALYSKLIYQIV